MGKSSIEWTGNTWNAIRARRLSDGKQGHYCQKVSPGCKNCYAERRNGWIGTHVPYSIDKFPQVEIYLDEKALLEPLKWKQPTKIFPCSMTDLFADFVPIEMIDKIFAVMALCPQHTFQVVTKRPARMLEYLLEIQNDDRDMHRWEGYACEITDSPCAAGVIEDADWPLPNVWLGVSVENQETANDRIPLLLQTPAAKRWISAEPLLGPIDLDSEKSNGLHALGCGEPNCECGDRGLDWVVAGGESGPGARPMNLEWAQSIVDQCKAAKVPVFVKQLGAVPMEPADTWRARHSLVRLLSATNRNRVPEGFVPLKYLDKKGGNIDEFPAELQIREYPEVSRAR